MPRTWPLVGRDEELRAAGGALGPRATHSGVVLSGPAGVGKTRLAREIVARLKPRCDVRWVLATQSARSLPLGAFNGLIEEPSALLSLGSAAREVLKGGERPVVVAVDDAHLLDDASACLVQRMVARREAAAVLTLRDGESVPDAVAALWKDDYLHRIDVEALSEPDTRILVERVLGDRLDRTAADRLWAMTRGNALFLRHLVDGEVAARRLRRGDGLWHWTGSPDLSPLLADVVSARMGDLPAPVRDVLDVLALAEPLSVAAVDSLISAAALEDAEDRGLVTVDDAAGGLARLAHPMYGEVRREAIGELRARRLRGLAVNTLVATGEADDDPVRRALLLVDSDLQADPALLTRAAHAAVSTFELATAERLARAAVGAGAGPDAQIALASTLGWSGRGVEADAILQEVESAVIDPAERVGVTLLRVGALFWPAKQVEQAESVLHAALAEVPPGPDALPLEAMQSTFDASLGRTELGLQRARATLGRDAVGLPAVMAALAVLSTAAPTGRLEMLRWAAGEAERAAEGVSFMPQFGAAEVHITGLGLLGQIAEARDVADRMWEVAADHLGPAHTLGRLLDGRAELCAGRLGPALELLGTAAAALDGTGLEFGYRCRTALTTARALRGDAVGARQLLERIEEDRHPAFTFLRGDDLLARAWTLAAEGLVSEAVDAARTTASSSAGDGAWAYEVVALQAAAQLGDPSGAPRLRELRGMVEGQRAAAAYDHAHALGEGDGEALVVVSRQWEEIGDGVAAADAAAQAAVLLREAGRKGSALSAAARAQWLADERCQGARTPAIRAAAQPLPLTGREREIVGLAARGLTNKEMADKLTVSVRTVEGHLYRSCQKLGVHDRSELANLLAID